MPDVGVEFKQLRRPTFWVTDEIPYFFMNVWV